MARLIAVYPGFHGIQNFGEARGAERAAVSGVDNQGRFDFCATFSPRITRATVEGFDRIARAHASATRKWAFKSGEAEASALCVPILLLLPLAPSPHPASPLSTPPLRRHGEGENGGAGTREEGDGGGEKQEDESGIFIALGAAVGLDPGRLDPILTSAGRLGRYGRVRADRP